MMSQVSSFCKDVVKSEVIWVLQFNGDTYVNWVNEDGSEVFPVWSSESRVKKVIKLVDVFLDGKAFAITLDDFTQNWIPKFEKDKVSLGPNWVGENLSGTTFSPASFLHRIERYKSS